MYWLIIIIIFVAFIVKIALNNHKITKENYELKTKIAVQQNENENLNKIINQKNQDSSFEEQKMTQNLMLIANKIFEEKTIKLQEINQQNFNPIFQEITRNIENLRNQANSQLEQETRQRSSLESQIIKMIEQTNQVSNQANNLAQALKTQAKHQGNWGEALLETILQNSGMIEKIHYHKQFLLKDENGKQFIPDFIIKLPQNKNEQKIIIVDAKLSLTAFEKYCHSNNENEQKIFLKEHLDSIKNSILNNFSFNN